MNKVLEVRHLHTRVVNGQHFAEIVRGVDLDVAAGETVAVVGETGSGKSMTAFSIAGLLPNSAAVTSGSVLLEGKDILALKEPERRHLRGAGIAMIYQDPMTSLNPMMRIGDQVEEGLRAHGWAKPDAAQQVLKVFEEVGLPHPQKVAKLYPHQLSGGMRQRVLIAMAIALKPKVLIADEPTTALDVIIQRQILDLVARLRNEYKIGIIWITHDLGVVARVADRVAVMYAGKIVEVAQADRFFAYPTHPYSAGLLAAIPATDGTREPLSQIGGEPISPVEQFSGCPFAPRCRYARPQCKDEEPPLLRRGDSLAACWVAPEEWC